MMVVRFKVFWNLLGENGKHEKAQFHWALNGHFPTEIRTSYLLNENSCVKVMSVFRV